MVGNGQISVNFRTRLKAVLILSLVFATGGLAGMVLEEALGLDWFDFLDPQPVEAQVLDRLLLTPDQRDRIELILQQRNRSLEAHWSAELPELQAIVFQSHDAIRAVLSPEQRVAFDAAIKAQGIQVPDRD